MVNQEGSDGENERVVADDYADEGGEDVEIEVELATTGATFVADPDSGGLEDTGNIQGNGHVCERDGQDGDLVWLGIV
jgi:hypothetical protein